MTKQEQDLILSLTELETAIARLTYYEDQESYYEDIENALAAFKTKFYHILLEKEEE